MLSPTLPMYPWQKVSSDLFTLKGRNYLLIVDSFSRFPEVVQLSSTSSQTMIGILKSVFARFGIPEILVTDNGPQYASKHMAEFAKSYGFQHTTSSLYYPQGNGQAERTVKTVKSLIQNADDPFLALLNYRATPLPWCNLSPAELLFGRRIRTTIPQLPCQMVPSWSYLQKFRTSDEEAKQRQKENYDLRHGVKPLPELEVWVTNRGKRGTITSKTNPPRSYIINTPEGTIRRNRRHLIAVPRASTHCAENNPGDDENHSHDDGDTPEVKEELRDNMQREQLSEPVITEEHEDENQHLSKLRSPILTRTRTGNTLNHRIDLDGTHEPRRGDVVYCCPINNVSMATSSEEVVSSFPKMTIHVSSDGAGAVHPDPTPACVNVTMDSSQQSRTVSIEEELIHHINHSSGKEMVQSYLTYPVQISLFIDKKKLFGVKSSLFSQLAFCCQDSLNQLVCSPTSSTKATEDGGTPSVALKTNAATTPVDMTQGSTGTWCNIATPERDAGDYSRDGHSQEGEARDQTSSPTSPTKMEGTGKSPGTAREEGRQSPPPSARPRTPRAGWGKRHHARVPNPLENGGNMADEEEEAAALEEEPNQVLPLSRTSKTPSF
ncbi:hypothetical protein EMCRGX_G008003 [Ephydatia muelleri]